MYNNMANYEDEEMFMRRQFVQNIPYFRRLNHQTLAKIVLMMEPKFYEYGDLIVGSGENHDCIFIIWNGFVQIRAYRKDWDTDEEENLWFDTVGKGCCFNVYNSWKNQSSQALNFYANSKYVVVYRIKIADLLKLGKKDICINDNLNIVKLRIEKNKVDNLDYFPFPKKHLMKNNINLTKKDFI